MSSRKSLSFNFSDHNFVCIYYLYQFNLRPTHPFILVLTLLEVFYKNTDSEVHQHANFLDSNCFIFLKYKVLSPAICMFFPQCHEQSYTPV
jgi:hypothetical protein